jgi:hypothetical protein
MHQVDTTKDENQETPKKAGILWDYGSWKLCFAVTASPKGG